MFQDAFMQIGQVLLGGERLKTVDAGGANGLIPHWQKFQGNAIFHLYEPHQESFNKLKQIYAGSPFRNDFRFIPTALSGTGGLRTFYATNVPTGSSLLRPRIDDPKYATDPYFVPVREVLTRTETLANSLDAEGVDLIDAIKLDVQGAELEILQGLDERRLNNVLAIELELGLIDCYEKTPTFTEVQQFLSGYGLELYDVRTQRADRINWSTQESYDTKYFGEKSTSPTIASRVNEMDLVFIRSAESLAKLGSVSQLRKTIFCQCVFNFLSEAVYLITDAETASLLPADERNKIYELLKLWQQVNGKLLENYQSALRTTDNQIWAQYTWVPYPCA